MVTVMPIVIGALETVSKILERWWEELEIGKQLETIQTTVLLRLARMLRRVLEIWRDKLLLRLHWSTTS